MALNPATPLVAVTDVLDLLDLLLVMTVNPGFGGQRYIATMEPKIAAARAEIDRRGLPIALEVDGGIGAADDRWRGRGRGRHVRRRFVAVHRRRFGGRPGRRIAGRRRHRLARLTLARPQPQTPQAGRSTKGR